MESYSLSNRKNKHIFSGRFAFLFWPLELLKERIIATQKEGLFSRRASKRFYPIRAIRYWWAHCALLEELSRKNKELIIADVGCKNATIKRYMGNIPNTKWIGLDWKINAELLQQHGYDDFYDCNFAQPLPLPDESVDLIIFLHVIEHLTRPDFTMSELSRILRPGGLILAGSPVAPKWIALKRESQHQKNLKAEKIKLGDHINSMYCERWRELIAKNGMITEILTGTFLIRWSGSLLENQKWWIRFNQLWGAAVPSLGGEVYLAARKISQSLPEEAEDE